MAEDERGEVDLPARAQLPGERRARRGVHALGRELVGGEADADGELRPRAVAHRGEHLAREARAAPRRRPRAGWRRARRTGRSGSRATSRPRCRRPRPPGSGAPRWRSPRASRRSRRWSAPAARPCSAARGRRRARPSARAARRRSAPGRRGRAARTASCRARAARRRAARSRRRSPGRKPPSVCEVSRPARVDRGRLDEDPAHAAARAGLVVGDQVGRREVVVHQAGLVRGRDDAVRQRHRAEVDGREELHGRLYAGGRLRTNVNTAGRGAGRRRVDTSATAISARFRRWPQGGTRRKAPSAELRRVAVPLPYPAAVDVRAGGPRPASSSRRSSRSRYGRARRCPPRSAIAAASRRSDRSIAARSGASPRAAQSAR